MEKKPEKKWINSGMSLFLSVALVFCVLGAVVIFVAQRISREMSDSAIQNLSESLDLIQSTIEMVLESEAEFQSLVAREVAKVEDPEHYIHSFEKNQIMVKTAFIPAGKTEGYSNTGETFTAGELDFSAGGMVRGMPVSQSYLNHMGTWAYTIQCPVERDGRGLGTLYVEYVYDLIDNSLPNGFYDRQATLYIMDTQSQRFVLKPKGLGMRSAGHLNLDDYYRANDIVDAGIRAEVARCLEQGENALFYHDIRGVDSLNYMWSVNDGTSYLVGYVPVEAIQQEGRSVNQSILIVVLVMLAAFLLCCTLYYINQRQQIRLRREREEEREVHNRQLAEALHAAQVASSSKTTFLSNMSHDIRTPMNAVLGFTTLLAKDADDPAKVREYTKKIMASGQHLLSLINDILDVSKIESGKVVLNLSEFTLGDLVSSVDAIIQPMAAARGQTLDVEVDGVRHEHLIGDETRINQILINLLSNAVKYTPEGGHIWFRILGQRQRSSQFQHLRVEVEDNGYGMTPEFLTTIFDAFTRAENSTTNKVQGTGLGMAITKNIVEMMGGTIDVTSQVGKGSLFRVELELRIPEGHTERQFWEQNGIRRILVAHASPDCLNNIQLMLEDVGVGMDGVTSAEEAVALSMGAPDSHQLALLDLDLPSPGALSAARQLRQLLGDAVPILFLAHFDAHGTEEALALGNTGVLTKPFFVTAMREKLLEMQGSDHGEAAEAANSLAGLHFLAAEDNEINAEILTELLAVEEATCEVVENGQLAVERFAAAPEGEFHAILMDVQMPVMNGYDATRAIRALARPDAGTIPIIAMTANAFAEDERAALDAGMNAHVAKPLDVQLLKKVIHDLTHQSERN